MLGRRGRVVCVGLSFALVACGGSGGGTDQGGDASLEDAPATGPDSSGTDAEATDAGPSVTDATVGGGDAADATSPAEDASDATASSQDASDAGSPAPDASDANVGAVDASDASTGAVDASDAASAEDAADAAVVDASDGSVPNVPVSLSANALSFGTSGNVPCGTQATAQMVTVTNVGATTETFWFALGLGAASPYGVTPSCTQASPCSVSPGAANAVTLSIQPATVSATGGIGAINDTLTVTSSAPGDSGQGVTLAEQPYGAILAFNPTDENFGTPAVGSSTPATVNIVNTGNAPVTVAIAESGSNEFALSTASVDVGTSTPGSFGVTFAPGLDTTPASGTVGLNAPANSLCAAPPAALTLEGQGTGYPTNCAVILAAASSSPSGIYTIAPGGTAISAYCNMTDLGGGWTQIVDDDTTMAPGFESKATWAGPLGTANSGQYSIANLLAAVHSGTNYTLLLQYPLIGGYEQWTQVENPTSLSATLPTLVGTVAEGGSTLPHNTPSCSPNSAAFFAGLYLSNDPTYFSGDPNPGCYWYAVGEVSAYGAGIPAYNEISTTHATLYVR